MTHNTPNYRITTQDGRIFVALLNGTDGEVEPQYLLGELGTVVANDETFVAFRDDVTGRDVAVNVRHITAIEKGRYFETLR